MTVEQRPAWWVVRPSLEYQHAFDWTALQVHRHDGSAGVFASSAFYARELCKRLAACDVRLQPVGLWSPPGQDAATWLGPEVDPSRIQALEALSLPLLSGAVWAEPEMGDGQRVLQQIRQALRPEGQVCVVASDWPASYLPEWRQTNPPAARPAGRRRTVAWLRQAGFEVETSYGFHGPVSLLWGFAARWMGRFGRDDWADRCHFQMRAKYAVKGWQLPFAPVGVILAQRGGW